MLRHCNPYILSNLREYWVFMLYRRVLLQLCWYLITPLFLLCIPQALHIKKTALRLPEAKGDHTVTIGANEKRLKFNHYGESTVAGVGVELLKDALSAQLCQTLTSELQAQNTRVQCHITGQNGIRFHELNSLIAQQKEPADFTIITMGVNDTTGFTSVKRWQQSILQSITLLQQNRPAPIFFTQVPPMAQFPALPAPLRYVLGFRAYLLNFELQRICAQHKHCHYIGSKLLVEKDMMAKDGYHPSALGYAAWAKQITPQILKILQCSK